MITIVTRKSMVIGLATVVAGILAVTTLNDRRSTEITMHQGPSHTYSTSDADNTTGAFPALRKFEQFRRETYGFYNLILLSPTALSQSRVEEGISILLKRYQHLLDTDADGLSISKPNCITSRGIYRSLDIDLVLEQYQYTTAVWGRPVSANVKVTLPIIDNITIYEQGSSSLGIYGYTTGTSNIVIKKLPEDERRKLFERAWNMKNNDSYLERAYRGYETFEEFLEGHEKDLMKKILEHESVHIGARNVIGETKSDEEYWHEEAIADIRELEVSDEKHDTLRRILMGYSGLPSEILYEDIVAGFCSYISRHPQRFANVASPQELSDADKGRDQTRRFAYKYLFRLTNGQIDEIIENELKPRIIDDSKYKSVFPDTHKNKVGLRSHDG